MKKKEYQKPATQVIQLQQRTCMLQTSGNVDSLYNNSPFIYQGVGDPFDPLILVR